jgi:hypothetical protein
MQKLGTIWEKRHFYRRKLAKLAENCDHNITPGVDVMILKMFSPKKFARTMGVFLFKILPIFAKI